MKPTTIGDLLDRYHDGERDFADCHFDCHDNLQFMTFDYCVLDGSTFNAADFTHSTFVGASLKSCVFRNCQFEHVDFSDANFSSADLTGATFKDCEFKNASFDQVKYFDHRLNTEDFLKYFAK
ncbi:pentapeptide repeat-containing protein [Flavobacterium sp.]|uniref:pentapeptide repeat-containing protein n=1 Tax=Flavobacterium sp. TaxID=239 RepID=UPI0039E4B9FB